MKTLEQINAARNKLCQRAITPGLNDVQKGLVTGMLNTLVWAVDGAASSTMEKMLSDAPMAVGKDLKKGLETLDDLTRMFSRWVSVKDRLPTYCYSVVVWVVGGPMHTGEDYLEIGIYVPDDRCWKIGTSFHNVAGEREIYDEVVKISHWMEVNAPC